MAVVNDDFNAINPVMVSGVLKPMLDTSRYLTVFANGLPMTLWFDTADARDSFYKTLVDAIGKL